MSRIKSSLAPGQQYLEAQIVNFDIKLSIFG
jgi:hypothetical protein